MKRIAIVSATLMSLVFCSSQICLAASVIPIQFRGNQGSADQCKVEGDNVSSKISATEINDYESSFVLTEVLKSDDLSFEGKFACEGEGEQWEVKFSLKRVKDKLIRDGGEATPKCK